MLKVQIFPFRDVVFQIEQEVHRAAIVEIFPLAMANRSHLPVGPLDAPEEGAIRGFRDFPGQEGECMVI